MNLPVVSSVEVRGAQIATLSTFALWMAIGYLPGLGRHANMLRGVLLAAYLTGAIGFVAYVLVRR
jgi:hypothetical protein